MSYAKIFMKAEQAVPELTDKEAEDINEQVQQTSSICHLCVHRGDDPYVCDAFPKGIPVSILMGTVSHQVPLEGDNGIQFERKGAVLKADVSSVPRDERGRWTKITGAQGSNPGGIFEKDGTKHYVKFPNASGQVASEVASDNLHELMGVQTMRHEARYLGEKLASVSKLQPVTPLGKEGWSSLTEKQKQQAANAFVASAWAKNWDIVGLEYDNIGKTSSGDLAVFDTGGSFTFRAQGGHKDFGHDATPEVQSFLNPKRTAGSVFGPLYEENPKLFKNAVGRLKKITDKEIETAVGGLQDAKELLDTLKKRRDSIAAFFDKIK